MSDKPLKLSAFDADDLEVMSSLLQDAVLPVSDMTYLREDRLFAMAVSRFRWELAPVDGGLAIRSQPDRKRGDPAGERVNCGIRFEGVQRVSKRGIDATRRDAILELSAIRHQDESIILVFAGGGMVRLEVDGILCHLEDFGVPWPTIFQPKHGPDSADQS